MTIKPDELLKEAIQKVNSKALALVALDLLQTLHAIGHGHCPLNGKHANIESFRLCYPCIARAGVAKAHDHVPKAFRAKRKL